MPRDTIFSIKPIYTDLILSGVKTAEIRRKCQVGTVVGGTMIIYATKPVGMVVGYAKITGNSYGCAHDLWLFCGGYMGITQEELANYLGEDDSGHALYLSDIHKLKEPIPLPCHPPQSYRYAEPDFIKKVLSLPATRVEPKE